MSAATSRDGEGFPWARFSRSADKCAALLDTVRSCGTHTTGFKAASAGLDGEGRARARCSAAHFGSGAMHLAKVRRVGTHVASVWQLNDTIRPVPILLRELDLGQVLIGESESCQLLRARGAHGTARPRDREGARMQVLPGVLDAKMSHFGVKSAKVLSEGSRCAHKTC